MANLFSDLARKATANSVVRVGRTKISMDEIMAQFPNGVTITEFDMLSHRNASTGEIESFPTFAFAEDASRFFNGGSSLTNIANTWLAHFNGDIEECNRALKVAGGVRIKILPRMQTKNGTWFVPVEVVG